MSQIKFESPQSKTNQFRFFSKKGGRGFAQKAFSPFLKILSTFSLSLCSSCYFTCGGKSRSGAAKWLLKGEKKAEQKVFSCHVLGQQFSQEKVQYFSFFFFAPFFCLDNYTNFIQKRLKSTGRNCKKVPHILLQTHSHIPSEFQLNP